MSRAPTPRGLLAHPPNERELERVYWELARIGAPSVGKRRPWRYRPAGREELVALAGDMLRYDPRLLSVLLQLFLERWEKLDPVELRRQMRRMRWPQALLVVFAFARLATTDAEVRHLVDYLSAGWPRVEPAERFFLDAERPGSRTAERRLGRNLGPYARWGFIGAERPTADAAAKTVIGRYDARTRRDILRALLERRGEVTLRDYLEAVEHAVTRQQALADLHGVPGLALVGHGRAARWRRADPPKRPPGGAAPPDAARRKPA